MADKMVIAFLQWKSIDRRWMRYLDQTFTIMSFGFWSTFATVNSKILLQTAQVIIERPFHPLR